MKKYLIAGIHTGTGKTVCSAVICQAMGWDYWKPVQAGEEGGTDSDCIRSWVTHPGTTVHPERYRLRIPASPHYAAAEEGLQIAPEDFTLPATANGLLVETAGGVMSPLARGYLNADLMRQLQLPAIVVSSNYLGSINHTLLTVNLLRQYGIPLAGIVFSGEEVPATRSYILEHTGLPLLFSIPQLPAVNAASVAELAAGLNIRL